MWWNLLGKTADEISDLKGRHIKSSATVAKTAILEKGVVVGKNTIICPGAYIRGPVVIGDNCLIGNNTMIRGPLVIGDGTRIGFAAEIKGSVIGKNVSIGPMCFVGDSIIGDDVYLGAMVRTSNQRLDRKPVSVMYQGEKYDTGLDKLGCHIGAGASLGIQVIILPGRVILPGTMFGPRITVAKNLPAGQHLLTQELAFKPLVESE